MNFAWSVSAWLWITSALLAQDVGARVDQFVRAFVADGHLSGSLLIADGDDIVCERHFGCANHELRVPVTATTRFCIASVTKPMTQAVLVSLIGDRKLAPADVLARWLPDFPRADEITVMHLLNHRAGIPHRVTTGLEEVLPQTAASMTARARAVPLTGQPGERSVYSSAGYSVLSHVAELASGMPFAELLRERVFAPAGLQHTVCPVGRELIPERAGPYVATATGLVNAGPKDLTFLVGAGSVHSTPRDLHRLVRAIAAGKLGDGVRANAMHGGRVDWNGAASGYRCFLQYDPKTGRTIVFAGNLATGAVERLRSDLGRWLDGAEVALPVRLSLAPVALSAAWAKALPGNYDFAGTRLELLIIDGQVWVGDVVLVPVAADRFFALRDYGTVTVVPNADGAVTGLRWDSGGRMTEMPRLPSGG